jgi:cation diffusion facilitator family transporter
MNKLHSSHLESKIKSDEINQRLIKVSTYVTVVGVALVILAKLYGWFITNSITMLASLTDSLLDICVSMMNLITVHYSLQPADHEHRFGHGKAEDIAVFVQASFFAMSGIFLIFTSVNRLLAPNEQLIRDSLEGVVILVFSTIITLGIVLFQHYVMRRVKSNVIEADSMHYFTDFMTNICAIIGIVVATYWHIAIFDSIIAIAIAIYIIVNSIRMFKRSFNNLMDHELDEKDRKMIIETIKSHKKVLGFHDLKTRYAGAKSFIQFHLELDENITLKQAHIIGIEVEQSILNKIPNAEIIIHQDPEGIDENIAYKD